VIAGGGVAGLVAALALRPSGHRVTVLDREPGPVPASVPEANSGWIRPSVPQALHSHAFTGLGTGLLREHVPELYEALVDAAAREIDLRDSAPVPVPLEDADELRVLACRRRTFDAVLAATARRLGVTVQADSRVAGLEISGGERPRVTGVRLADGGVLEADLVLDATGQRCESRKWLAVAGIATAPDESTSGEFSCYSRFFRSTRDELPGVLNRGNAGGGIFGHYMAFVHPGDNGTFSIGIGVLPDDPEMKALRDEETFTAVLRATPLLAPWVAADASEAISPVYAINTPDNLVRGVATTRQRAVPGLLQLGDAAAVSNPLYGRGVSLAIAHAFRLAELLAELPEAGETQSARAAELVETLLVPWVHRAVADDRARIALWRAAVHGERPAPLPAGLDLGTATRASFFDAVVWRRLAAVQMSVGRPEQFYDDPEIRSRVATALDGRELPAPPAPSREELLRVVHGAGR
jgi:2-polyprenyl-6-methoxyphenol hydroxylase-like FAD-dependent oxidoreductase